MTRNPLPKPRITDSRSIIRPDWECSANIQACVTTRIGGLSAAPYDQLNLGDHVNDDPQRVSHNRALLKSQLELPAEPVWLQQVHGTRVVDAAEVKSGVSADAAFTAQDNTICAVLTADCLPVFFCTEDGSTVAVAHAGWRGLAAGILQTTATALQTSSAQILCWLGPAIGPHAFEVGGEVRETFISQQDAAAAAFIKTSEDHWLADIYTLARIQLKSMGISRISGGEHCTFTDAERFYSYRRDGVTGRMASLIWMSNP